MINQSIKGGQTEVHMRRNLQNMINKSTIDVLLLVDLFKMYKLIY